MSDNADAEKYAVLDQAAQSMAGAEDAGPPGEHGATAPPSAPAAPGLLREARPRPLVIGAKPPVICAKPSVI